MGEEMGSLGGRRRGEGGDGGVMGRQRGEREDEGREKEREGGRSDMTQFHCKKSQISV